MDKHPIQGGLQSSNTLSCFMLQKLAGISFGRVGLLGWFVCDFTLPASSWRRENHVHLYTCIMSDQKEHHLSMTSGLN